MKLPVILYRPKLLSLNGLVTISGGGVKFGMIKLGFNEVSIYPNSGIIWSNNGTVTFHGNCIIGNASSITVSRSGHLTIGNNVHATAKFKVLCYHKVVIGSHTLIGWDNTISDTDFHSIYFNDKKTKGYDKVIIGSHNWLAMECLVLKGSQTPDYCVLSARTMLNKDFSNEGEKILISGQPAKVMVKNIYHDRYDDKIEYEL